MTNNPGGLSLNTFQSVNVFFILGELTAGHSTPDVNNVSLATALLMPPIEPVLGLPHHEGTQEGPPAPFLRAVFSPAVLVRGVILPSVKDFVIVLIDLHEVRVGAFSQLLRSLQMAALPFGISTTPHPPTCYYPCAC